MFFWSLPDGFFPQISGRLHYFFVPNKSHKKNDVPKIALPICSMYGICTNIYPINEPNVGKYTIHGAYGLYMVILIHVPTELDHVFFWNISTIGRRWPISQVHIRHEALGESPGTTGAVRKGPKMSEGKGTDEEKRRERPCWMHWYRAGPWDWEKTQYPLVN